MCEVVKARAELSPKWLCDLAGMSVFGAYTTMSPEQLSEVAEAATEAAERAMRESFAQGEGFVSTIRSNRGPIARIQPKTHAPKGTNLC
jgi:hypothetical protein